MALFFTVVLSIWTAMHAYVLWRAWPLVSGHLPLPVYLASAAPLWAAYPASRFVHHAAGAALEYVGALWLGILFLLVVTMLAADLVTGFGLLAPAHVPAIRAGAIALAAILAAAGALLAWRDPAVRTHEVRLAGLPPERDGLRMVVVSDLHVGRIIGARWLEKRAQQIAALEPDLLVIAGDLVDADAEHVRPLVPALRRLSAPLGVFAVTGNHEYYAGVDESVAAMRDAGFRVLRDEAALALPGLVVAGVDDLTVRGHGDDGDTTGPGPGPGPGATGPGPSGVARGAVDEPIRHAADGPIRRAADGPIRRAPDGPIRRALAGRPPGATILVSHSPLKAREAAREGAGLMLSGHTHDGQIWPFRYLVKRRYPLIAGRYEVDGMTVLVGRGTGTWGPRLRLWRPSEILVVIVRAAPEESTHGANR